MAVLYNPSICCCVSASFASCLTTGTGGSNTVNFPSRVDSTTAFLIVHRRRGTTPIGVDSLAGWTLQASDEMAFTPSGGGTLYKRITVLSKDFSPGVGENVTVDPTPDAAVVVMGAVFAPSGLGVEDYAIALSPDILGSPQRHNMGPATAGGSGRGLVDLWLYDGTPIIASRSEAGLALCDDAGGGYRIDAGMGTGFGPGVTPVFWIEASTFVGDWVTWSMTIF